MTAAEKEHCYLPLKYGMTAYCGVKGSMWACSWCERNEKEVVK